LLSRDVVFAKEALVKTAIRSVLALSTLVSGASTAALAAPADTELATKVVSYVDLDLATAGGAYALYGRIVSAARAVCREETLMLVRDCRAKAVDLAVHGVNSPLLISIHRSAVDTLEEVVLR
jgi:UrcA family protein